LIFGERDRSSGLSSQLVPLTAGGKAERCWLRSLLLRSDAPYFLFRIVYNLSTSLCVQPSKQLVLLAGSFSQP